MTIRRGRSESGETGPTKELGTGHEDTQVFDLDFPGGTLLELLNTLVQSHGRLSWQFQSKPANRQFPITVTILSGGGGQGCSAPGISVPVSSTGLAPPPRTATS